MVHQGSRGKTSEQKILDSIDELADLEALKKKAAWDTFAWILDDVEHLLRAQTFETAILKFCMMERATFKVGEPRSIRIRGRQSHRKERTYECTLLESQRFRILRLV